MFIELESVPDEVSRYLQTYGNDVTAIRNTIKEIKCRLPEGYRPILDEVDKAVLHNELFKAFYLLIIFQRAIQDFAKKELKQKIPDKSEEARKFCEKNCRINKLNDIENLYSCCKCLMDEKERLAWDYTYSELAKMIPEAEKYKEMLREVRRLSNEFVHGLLSSEKMSKVLEKLDYSDLLILVYVIKFVLDRMSPIGQT